MKIEVKVKKVNLDKIKAFADITIEGSYVVKGLKVMEGSNGLFVSMPSTKLKTPYENKKGETVLYQDTFFPVTKEARLELIDAVLGAYNGEDDEPDF